GRLMRQRRKAPSRRSIQWLSRLQAPAPDLTARRHAAGVVLRGVDAREDLGGRHGLAVRMVAPAGDLSVGRDRAAVRAAAARGIADGDQAVAAARGWAALSPGVGAPARN